MHEFAERGGDDAEFFIFDNIKRERRGSEPYYSGDESFREDRRKSGQGRNATLKSEGCICRRTTNQRSNTSVNKRSRERAGEAGRNTPKGYEGEDGEEYLAKRCCERKEQNARSLYITNAQ
jgi:hypothetical protein